MNALKGTEAMSDWIEKRQINQKKKSHLALNIKQDKREGGLSSCPAVEILCIFVCECM